MALKGWIDDLNVPPAFGLFMEGTVARTVEGNTPEALLPLEHILPAGMYRWLVAAVRAKLISGVAYHQHLPNIPALNIELAGIPRDSIRAVLADAVNSMCQAAGLPARTTIHTPDEVVKQRIVEAYMAFQTKGRS